MASALARIVRAHLSRYVDAEKYAADVADQMCAYEDAENARASALLARGDAPDEDGFVTVVSRRVAARGFGAAGPEAARLLASAAPGMADAVEAAEAERRGKRAAKRARRAQAGGTFYGPALGGEGAGSADAAGPQGAADVLRREQISDLRRRFAEDRQMLAHLKKSRTLEK